MADPADLQRLIGDIVREGTVASVDLAAGTARVQFADELVTGDLPWLAGRAGATRTWSPPCVGEQVVVLAPEADAARGIIIGSLSCDQHPHPASTDKTLIDFADGALIGYDPVEHVLSAALPAGGKVTIVAPGGFHLTGPLEVDGDIRSTAKITAADDVVGGGKSLKLHTHTAVQPGSGFSGPPR